MHAPVVLFVYNRLDHTEKTVAALQKNELAEETDLFVVADAAVSDSDLVSVNAVRNYIQKIKGFKCVHIILRECNYGLAKSIISGVSTVVNQYGRVIVLEDDLVTSPYFIRYMNAALDFYEEDSRVFSIGGYAHPPRIMKIPDAYSEDIYFSPRPTSWGWGTWAAAWNKADWEVKGFQALQESKKLQRLFNAGGDDMFNMLKNQMNGKINSWAIRWCYTHFENKAVSVYPVASYINNIGHDGSGVHCVKDTRGLYVNELTEKKDLNFIRFKFLDRKIMKAFQGIYKRSSPENILRRCKRFLGRILH